MYKFTNSTGEVKVSSGFAHSCAFVQNLFQDTGDSNTDEPILFSDNYCLSELKKMEAFFTEFQAMKVEDKPYLDFITENKALYREKYSDMPHVKKILELYKKYETVIEKIPEYNTFLNNDKLILATNLCILAFIDLSSNREEIIRYIMELMQA